MIEEYLENGIATSCKTTLTNEEINTLKEDFVKQLGNRYTNVISNLIEYNKNNVMKVIPITVASSEQLTQLCQLHEMLFDRSMKVKDIENSTKSQGTLVGPLHTDKNLIYLLATDDKGNVIGYTSFANHIVQRCLDTPEECYHNKEDIMRAGDPGIYIMQIGVDRRIHGRGIGKFLYNALAQALPDMPLYSHVNNQNENSYKFHLNFGFNEIASKSDKFLNIPNYVTRVMKCDPYIKRMNLENNQKQR